MKKKIALLLSFVILFMMLAGCSQTQSTQNEKVNLDVIISQYGNYTQGWWSQFENDFEKENRDIDLKIEIVNWDDIYTVVNTRIATNQAPDILNIDTFADYVADNLLMPADEYTSDGLKSKIYPSFWNANEINGKVWALPILASVRVLFSNMDLLKEAGIEEPPKTWDDVLVAGKAVKEKFGNSVIPWALDISTDEGQADFAYYAWNNGGDFVDDEGKWALNSEQNIEAMEYIKTLFDSGFCNSDPYNDTKYPLQDAFSAGSLAMIIAPCNLYDFASNVNFSISPIPVNNGNEHTNMGVCDRLLTFKNEKVKNQAARTEAITKFYDFFYETNRYSSYMVYEGFLPVTIDSSELLSNNAVQFTKGGTEEKGDSKYFATFTEELSLCKFYPSEKTEWIDVKQGIIAAEQKVCQGMNAKEALDELQASIQK